MDQFVGQRIGDYRNSDQSARYEVKAILGRQTGRRTLLAEDSETGCLVVIKLMLFGPDFTWQDLKLFEREAETLKSLDHPAIPKYLDSFEVETHLGKGFALVQTYIEAKSLQEWVSSGSTFSEDDLRAIASNLLHILNYLHHRQPPVIHRDIKPSNILLTAQHNKTPGSLYLVDFGSVQNTFSNGTITVVGTYGYMPPEQFGGRSQPASDLYSVGATLIYLVAGKHPADLIQSNLQIDFDDTHISYPFSTWLRHLTYTDLERRTPSALQALQELTHPEHPKQIKHGEASSKILRSAFDDFTVDSTYRDLIVQFSESRLVLRKDVITSAFPKNQRFSKAPPWIMLSGMLIMFLAIILPDLYAIIDWIAPATLLLLLLDFILWRSTKTQKTCQLRLLSGSKNLIFLSLVRTASAPDTGWISGDSQQNECSLLSNVLLNSWSIIPGMFKDRIKFVFSDRDTPQKSSRLDVCGSRQQIEWLCEHLSRWSNEAQRPGVLCHGAKRDIYDR